jgi:dTDP-4-amino-4,6-dideoxygalactose transaminase
MRKLPPVGTRIQWRELGAALKAGRDAEAALAAALDERIPHQRAFFFGSGRAALAAILTAMRQLREGDAVIVPAYTCWSVPAAIVRAGLRVLPVDMRPGELDFDYEQMARLDWRGVLAVVSPGLFGLPADLEQLEGLCDDHAVSLIDDAAQCLGASLDGRAAGSFGDVGLVSFGRGKNIGGLGGGAALVREPELARALESAADVYRNAPAPDALSVALKGGATTAALSPSAYGLAEMAPGVVVGRTVYDPKFPTAALGPARAALAAKMLQRLDDLNTRRAQWATAFDRSLAQVRGLALPKPRSGSQPAWLRRPILTVDATQRDPLLQALQAAGVGATHMYPTPIHLIPELEPHLDRRAAPFPGARKLAESLIALPLVEGMTAADLQRITNIAVDILGRRRGGRWA